MKPVTHRYLLDTHIILWFALEPQKLSDPIKEILAHPDSIFFTSATSAAEIACGTDKGRIELPTHWKTWFRQALDVNGWECLPVTLDIMEEAYSLPEPFHADPADRVLVATARQHRLTLLTADGKILNYPHVESKS